MSVIRYLTDIKRLLVLSCFYCLALPAFSKPITFEHVVIDEDAIGHREVGDIDRDGFNDIVSVNVGESEHSIVWYEYANWRRHRVVNINGFSDYKAYRSCDMELADIDSDGDLDVVGRVGKPKDDRYGINCWFENPGPGNNSAEGEWKRHDIGESYYAKDLEVADLDGDGKLDVASRALNAKLHIYLQEDSSWKEMVLDITHHDGMDVADMDRDGDPDIVLNGYWMETPDDPLGGTWAKHDFDKKWYTQKTGEKGAWYDNNCKVAVADMNADGCLDIVIDQAEDKDYPVSWYQAPPDPRDGRWIEHVIGQVDKCHSLKVADFDNDGDLDIFAAEMPNIAQEAPHPVMIFVNQGDSLTWGKQVLADYGNYSAQIGDIDNDGDMDIIGLRNHNRAPVEMWRNKTSDNKLSLDKWTYIEVDNQRGKWGDWNEPDWLRYFGLAMADVTGDGRKDIIAGRYFYRNPGGDMTRSWQRITFDINVDAMLVLDVDGDPFADVIAEALPDVYWLEAQDKQGDSWSARKVGTLPKTGHVNGQGYMLGQLIAGGKPEIILASGDGIYYFQIPKEPETGNWPKLQIASETMDEGIGVGDIDGDGDVDIAAGKGVGKAHMVMWYENPGNGAGNWKGRLVSEMAFAPDRIVIAEINGDSRPDVVVSEERYPGPDPDASLYWFEQPSDPKSQMWKKHVVVTEYSLNNLDVADMDRDGDFDVVTCEHKGPKGKFRLQIFENDGKGDFTEHVADRGKESHLGALVADMDNDGDLDIVSAAWDNYQYLHLWRNDAIK
ncbi:MAG: FG-GAP repeat domain-containing protein [Planctomycetota bacterium]